MTVKIALREEKVLRFRAEFSDGVIDNFYPIRSLTRH